MKSINCTPHDVVLKDDKGNTHVFPKSGIVLRAPDGSVRKIDIKGFDFPLFTAEPDMWAERGPEEEVIHFARRFNPKEGKVAFICSMAAADFVSKVLSQYSEFDHIIVVRPGTGPQDGALRNEQGQISAVTRFYLV